jgi:hypothetical protein
MPGSVDVSPLTSPWLYYAEQAVKYVEFEVEVAGNRVLDLLATSGGSYVCVSAARLFNPDDKSLPKLERIHRWAATAEAVGCGNCGEQAAVAFVYLEKLRTVRPLEFMYVEVPYDHNYVVIGRPESSDVSDPATWGSSAVVCDPWKDKSYPPADFATIWPGRTPACFYRLP